MAAAFAAFTVMMVALPAATQTTPFGVTPPPAPSGISGWIFAEQAKFFRALSGAVRQAKADGTATYALIWLSFLYGIFHAAGPGHGKAVISSYLLADGSTIPRGIALSAISAFAQALTAIALVGVAAVGLGLTARAMGDTVRWLELASYALIVAFGFVLAWRKGRDFLRAYAASKSGEPAEDPAHHDHHHHDHDGHAHSHGPEPAELKGQGWLRRGLGAVVAVGMRPCSGAILVLVFALSQGIFLVGVVSTFAMAVGTAITVAAIAVLAVGARGLAARFAAAKTEMGMVVLRGFEFAASLLVIAVGILLMTGFLASERMFPA
jgi:ABC-type nickel/cobalt efflux system permease component RcnA